MTPASPCTVHLCPAERGEMRQRLTDQVRLAEGDLAVRGRGGYVLQIGEVSCLKQGLVLGFVFGDEQKFGN